MPRSKPQAEREEPEASLQRPETPATPKPERVLVRNVAVDGKVFGPAAPDNLVTPQVAAQITNPAAWGD